MSTKDTGELLRAFTEKGSEDAFQELVARYIDLVYSIALRRVGGNAHQAQDVTQTVFSDLAGKARSLSSGVQLGGWLHRHTCFVAANFTRTERRRQAREQIAVQMNTVSDTHDASWNDVAPALDDAVDQLDDPDRMAVILRFYEQYDLRRLGAVLGVGEDAAQKRVSRALDKLRELLVRRGVALSAIALANVLATHAVIAAPLGLAQAVARKSFAKAAAGAGVFAGLLGLLTSTAMKVGFCMVALVAVIATVKWRQSQSPTVNQPGLTSNEAVVGQIGAANTTGGPSLTNELTIVTTPAEALPANPEIIRLTILAADSGKPVPNVLVDYRGRAGAKFTGKKFTANRGGVCDVSVSRATLTDLQLTTRIDGFADTRLFWRPDRGEQIPTNYTVRLVRSVPISGRVVDADNQPVEGAKVGFNHEADPASESPPQDHQFSWIEVLTDPEGRWKIDRIAPEMIQRIYGSARHSAHVNSPMIFAVRDREAEKQLRDGTHVFRLGRSLRVRGVVVGPDDQAISDAKVFVGGQGESGKRETTSGIDGSFTVAGCKPGKNLVTAEAKGFAPVTVQIQAAADSEPIRLKLEAGRALILRMVDQMNRPVPGTYVWLRTHDRHTLSASNPPPLQASFSPKTDADGRAIWEDAPDRELTFDFQAAGFMRLNDVKIRPDGQEHVISLPPALTVFGTVRDENGQPVPRFRIISGWPGSPADAGVMWSTLDRFWLSFAGGEYRHSFEEAVVSGTANRGYVLKFEAEDYAPFVSRVIRADEGEARIEVTLRSAQKTAAMAVFSDGRPATGADVGFVRRGASLRLKPGGFDRQNVSSAGSLLRTDDKGRFHVPPDDTISRVIVAHPDGYAEATVGALATERTMVLKPWARLEGSYTSGGNPADGRTLQVDFQYQDYASIALDFMAFRTDTDRQGQFVFPQIPPGQFKLDLLTASKVGDTTSWSHTTLVSFEAVAGETKTITLGACTVFARLRWSDELKRETGWRIHAGIRSPFPLSTADADNTTDAFVKWRHSPEFKPLAGSGRYFSLVEGPEGILTARDVISGNYRVVVEVIDSAAPKGTMGLRAIGVAEVTVPTDPPGGTLELGEVVLRKWQGM